jgi:hypothetical protein
VWRQTMPSEEAVHENGGRSGLDPTRNTSAIRVICTPGTTRKTPQ